VNLTEQEKKKIIELIEAGKTLPAVYKSKLFNHDDTEFIEVTKDYRLGYKGKARKEDIIAQTPAAPFQLIRSFNTDNPFSDGWRNMLIFGDNLLALKTLYEDQRGENKYKTKNRIKLIYIDPPFATKQDFMKDREKAYRDKIIGAQFIEFLRKRFILLREILADDGSIFVHLDTKKAHYIKAILDEVFGEHNFRNEIIWKRSSAHSDSNTYANLHDIILFYTKSEYFLFNNIFTDYSQKYIEERYKHIELDENGNEKRFLDRDLSATGLRGGGYEYIWKGIKQIWRCPKSTMQRYEEENRLYYTRQGVARYKQYLDKMEGIALQDLWLDINAVNSQATERVNYPTQKPELLISRITESVTAANDIVLDAFIGSGTTSVVAEKMDRRWIGMDCGKLAIYTVQKRMLNMTTQIGSLKKDERRDYERVSDFVKHSKAYSRGLFFIYEKARKGDLIITDTFLQNLSEFISENLSGNKKEEFSFVCPESKLELQELKPVEDENSKAGEKIVDVGRVRFLISFIQPKEKTEKEKPLKAKEFSLFNAGVYDAKAILDLDWEQYKPFVAQLFSLRMDNHRIHGFEADGYIGVHSAFIWDYPNQKKLLLDQGYVKSLHTVLGGRAGKRFYVIAPVMAMGFMEDEIELDNTTYTFLKVPLSVLKALIEKGEPGSIKQPVSETDVNEVIDAVGFDFISQPEVKAFYHRRNPLDQNLFNADKKDFSIEISSFKSNTLVYDPEDFENFETFSMVLVDTDYNDDYFNLDKFFWASDILNENGDQAIIRIPEDKYTGKKMMVIFIDKYGNELKVVKTKRDFK